MPLPGHHDGDVRDGMTHRRRHDTRRNELRELCRHARRHLQRDCVLVAAVAKNLKVRAAHVPRFGAFTCAHAGVAVQCGAQLQPRLEKARPKVRGKVTVDGNGDCRGAERDVHLDGLDVHVLAEGGG